jgi:acetylornithine/succinyldiaminopimelate/putrescine aminotransferase
MTALVDTYAQFPLDIVSGSGSKLRARDGREYWDFYGGHAVALLGHSHPAVARAVAEQAARLTFYSNVLPLEMRQLAAERLAAFAPPELSRVFFCNSGAEANENALKLAIQHTGRRRIAALRGGWHGRSLLCLSATDDPKITTPLAPLLCDVVRLRPNNLGEVEQIDSSVAAVILEPIQSIGGIVEIEGGFLQALRRRCDQTGALLLYDEIQTGMGRLGRPLAAGRFGVMPDMVTLAKGIANGIPMGAVLMGEHVAARIKPGDLGSTFGGGPVACAALLAVLETLEKENLAAHAETLGKTMHRQLRVGPVEAVLGLGCLIGLRVAGETKTLQSRLMRQGFIVGTSANPQVLRLMPPLNTPIEAVAELAAALENLENITP